MSTEHETVVQRAEHTLPRGSVPSSRVELEPGTLLITDLHLAPLGDGRTVEFAQWCDGLVDVPRLVILGDYFDSWVGARQLRLEGSRAATEPLTRLVRRGTAVELIPGNRDALLDSSFESASGVRLHADGFISVLPGGATCAFVHGDSLCTLDAGYLRLRKLWRRGWVRALSRRTPLFVARRIGQRLRRSSETRKPKKTTEERSIRPAAVAELATRAGTADVICGHAHDPRDERMDSDGRLDSQGEIRWRVLGAWRLQGNDLGRVLPDGRIEFGDS